MQRPPSIRLEWFRHPTGRWSRLAFIDPDLTPRPWGVLVVWQEARTTTVAVAYGSIRDLVAQLRQNPLVRAFGSESLLVSWAPASPGAARYLMDAMKPAVRIPDPLNARPVHCNTPNII